MGILYLDFGETPQPFDKASPLRNDFAYFDASGGADNPSTPVLFMSGAVSSERKWARFEREWTTLLTLHGLSRPFRMSKFYATYRDRPSERDAFVQGAITVIKRGIYKSFSSGVDLNAFRQVADSRQLPSLIDDPYVLCGGKVIAQLARWVKNRNAHGLLTVRFEAGDRGTGKLLAEAKSLGIGVEFLSKSHLAAFDVGDMIAWLHSRLARHRLAGQHHLQVENWLNDFALRIPGEDAWGWHGAEWFTLHADRWPLTRET